MGKAFRVHKNNTVPIIPHVNYMYGVSTKRFNRIITTTRMPDYFTYLGGTRAANTGTHCAFCVFDGVLYTAFGRTAGGVIGDSSTESGDIYKLNFNHDTNLPTVGNIMVMSQVDVSLNHDTKLIEGSNMKVKFTDVFINSETPYDVYKGDGTSWIKFR